MPKKGPSRFNNVNPCRLNIYKKEAPRPEVSSQKSVRLRPPYQLAVEKSKFFLFRFLYMDGHFELMSSFVAYK